MNKFITHGRMNEWMNVKTLSQTCCLVRSALKSVLPIKTHSLQSGWFAPKQNKSLKS